MDYAEICYEVAKNFPKDETYGISSQLKRSAVSIPSNIAEGHGRMSRGEYVHFLGIARGSLRESETQLLLAKRFGFLSNDQLEIAMSKSKEVGILLGKLIKALKEKA